MTDQIYKFNANPLYVYGREISNDVCGSNVIFETAYAAATCPDTFAGYDLCDGVTKFIVTDFDGHNIDPCAVEFHEAQHTGKNRRAVFHLVPK